MKDYLLSYLDKEDSAYRKWTRILKHLKQPLPTDMERVTQLLTNSNNDWRNYVSRWIRDEAVEFDNLKYEEVRDKLIFFHEQKIRKLPWDKINNNIGRVEPSECLRT